MSDDQDISIKEASSLIVVAPEQRKKPNQWNPNAYSMEVEDKPEETLMDYKLLMTKRSNKSSFLASAYVFPGGHADMEDFDLDNWLNFFSRFKLLTYVDKLCQRNQQLDKPRILTNPLILGDNQLDNYLKPDIALRLTAIRETFEETGVLIAFNGEFIDDYRFELGTAGHTYMNEYLYNKNAEYIEQLTKRPEMHQWRTEIKNDANKFYQFCVHFDLIPNIFALHEWWNWQTPVTLGHKMFDTVFYVKFLPKKYTSTVDNSEVSKIEWLTPEEMLKDHLEMKAFIAPPQIYELSRLANFRDYTSLLDFSLKREKYGIEQWSYQITGLQDGALLALPGDEMYSIEGKTKPQVEQTNVTLSDLRTKADRLNRIELKVPIAIAYCKNIKIPHGQVSPITFDKNSKSKL